MNQEEFVTTFINALIPFAELSYRIGLVVETEACPLCQVRTDLTEPDPRVDHLLALRDTIRFMDLEDFYRYVGPSTKEAHAAGAHELARLASLQSRKVEDQMDGLTYREAAVLGNSSERTLQRAVAKGKIKSHTDSNGTKMLDFDDVVMFTLADQPLPKQHRELEMTVLWRMMFTPVTDRLPKQLPRRGTDRARKLEALFPPACVPIPAALRKSWMRLDPSALRFLQASLLVTLQNGYPSAGASDQDASEPELPDPVSRLRNWLSVVATNSDEAQKIWDILSPIVPCENCKAYVRFRSQYVSDKLKRDDDSLTEDESKDTQYGATPGSDNRMSLPNSPRYEHEKPDPQSDPIQHRSDVTMQSRSSNKAATPKRQIEDEDPTIGDEENEDDQEERIWDKTVAGFNQQRDDTEPSPDDEEEEEKKKEKVWENTIIGLNKRLPVLCCPRCGFKKPDHPEDSAQRRISALMHFRSLNKAAKPEYQLDNATLFLRAAKAYRRDYRLQRGFYSYPRNKRMAGVLGHHKPKLIDNSMRHLYRKLGNGDVKAGKNQWFSEYVDPMWLATFIILSCRFHLSRFLAPNMVYDVINTAMQKYLNGDLDIRYLEAETNRLAWHRNRVEILARLNKLNNEMPSR